MYPEVYNCVTPGSQVVRTRVRPFGAVIGSVSGYEVLTGRGGGLPRACVRGAEGVFERKAILLVIFSLQGAWGFCASAARPPLFSVLPEEMTAAFREYKVLNERETRCMEDRDSDLLLAAKLVQLARINEARAKNHASALQLDILASRIANRASREACEGRYQGHWNTRGEKPYHRYAFAGGQDHVAENAFAKWTSGTFPEGIETILALMKEGLGSFMNEKAPRDGHKQNCIDPRHNFVGIGCHLSGGQFRYYEEYLDRYLDFVSVPTEVAPEEPFFLEFKPRNARYCVHMLVVDHEPFPAPMSPEEISSRDRYSDFGTTPVLSLASWDLRPRKRDGVYRVPLLFEKEGVYYIKIYLGDGPCNKAYVTTEGKIQASGLVIRAEQKCKDSPANLSPTNSPHPQSQVLSSGSARCTSRQTR
jgi:hypothetical protein